MPSFLTAELAREAIGLYVVEKQTTGPASSAGWVCPAKLLRVISDQQCVVQPNGHRREEITEIRNLRLWMKGNHDLGEHAMKRALAIDAIADLKAQIARSSIRSITLQQARDWLGNGENPLVLCRVEKKSKHLFLGRLVGVREKGFVVRIVGDPDAMTPEVEEGCVGMPEGIDMSQLDYNLLEKALSAQIGKKIPDNRDAPVQAVRAEIPAHKPAPPAPKQALIPFPMRAAADEGEIPREPRPAGKGEWVIVDRKKRAFWAGATPTANGQWVKEIDNARVYENSHGVNVGVARMNRAEGDDPEPMSLKQAQFFYDMWYRPSRLAQVEAETKRIEAELVKPEVVDKTPALHPAGDGAQATSAARLAQAIRERAAAEAMLCEAKAKEALARADWEIERLGEA